MSTAERFLLLLILLGALGGAIRLLPRRIAGIPYQVVLAAAGLALGSIPWFALPKAGADLILLAFVPGLIFEAALLTDLERLRVVLAPVAVLATAGVVLTVAGTALLFHLLLALAWPSALVLGAILAPTDPIAVVSLVRRLGADARVVALLEGESLYNDGTGIAVFAAILATVSAGAFDPGQAAARFALITAGGAVVGAAFGYAGVLVLRVARDPEVEILISLVVAYGAFLAGTVAHVSGVVAVIAAGLVVARWSVRSPRVHREELVDFWSVLGFILNAILFVLIGESVPSRYLLPLLPVIAAAFAIVLAVRGLTVYGLLGATDPRRRLTRWRVRHLVFWGGLRGALSIALALSVAAAAGVESRVAVIAYGVVLLSLLLQGGTVSFVARRLRLAE